MTDTEFQKIVLEKLSSLEGKIEHLEGKVDSLDTRMDSLEVGQTGISTRMDSLEVWQKSIHEELTTFKTNQEDYNTAMWNLSNQAFEHISDLQHRATTTESQLHDIHREVVAPWKARKSI